LYKTPWNIKSRQSFFAAVGFAFNPSLASQCRLDTQRKELREGKRGDHYGMVSQFPTTKTTKHVVFWKNLQHLFS
jgi:hypothetical protein